MTESGRGQRRAKRPADQLEQWGRSRRIQPSEPVTLDQLEQCLKPSLAQNDVMKALQAMLLATKSARIAEAIQEIARLGLAGPDWVARLVQVAEHTSLGHINKLMMSVLLLASGSSQREIADQVAAQFGGGASFSAASKAVYRMLSSSELLSKLLGIPLAARRWHLRIARAKLGIVEGQNLTLAQAIEVLKTVVEAHRKANDGVISGCDPKPLGASVATRRKQPRTARSLGLVDDQGRTLAQTIELLKTIVEPYVKAHKREIARRD